MINQQSLTAIQDVLSANIERTLAHLGTGDMNSVAYDTAWIARLTPHFSDFADALTWLRQHQHSDGSWGSHELHYHDRAISTLAAIIALRLAGQGYQDEQRIRRGETFLWRINGQLHRDAHETVGFSVLIVSLINEAFSLGLDVPRDLYHSADIIEKKLNMLSRDPKLWRYTTMVFSLEAVRTYFPSEPDFLETNGSVGASPSATAALLLQSEQPSEPALRYLKDLIAAQDDGGVPDVAPIDTFEIAWSLNHFRLAGAITPDHPQVRRALDVLWRTWNPQRGLAFSSHFAVPDLDVTAAAFTVLQWAGYPVRADVFAGYEEQDHFRCYEGEIDPSLSAHIRMLTALKRVNDHPQLESWIDKIVATLRHYDVNGQFWFDKWHASPYYLTCIAIDSLQGISDDLAKSRISWICKTQQKDGGWGYFGRSTAEETAYCLQALLFWDRTVERIDPEQTDAAATFLVNHINDSKPASLWVGKCLYAPRLVVHSAVLSALFGYVVQND